MAENRKISRIKIGDETFDLKDPNQTEIEFDGSYDASTNKAATVKTVTDKINELDGGTIGTPGAGKTVTALSQLNGNISATFGDISITKSQVSDFPTSMPASDVSDWAKASTKPTYTYSEVGAASSGHTHAISIADSTGTSDITLAANTKYQLTAGGSTYIFTTPPDTTYSSKSAASGGTDVSLVTTGEKYTWNNKSSLALGETSSTAYRGDRGKTAYDHSQSTHARTDATAVTSSTTNGNIKIDGTETTVYTHPGSGTNPHGTTASDVGLGNVGNFKAVSTVANQGLSSTEQSNARTNIGAGTSNLTIGTTATTAAAGDHSHTTSLATDTGTSSITLESAGIYKLTAGGNSVIFTMPTIPTVNYPVTSVNSKTGAVSLTASDVGAATSGHTHTASIASSTGTSQLTMEPNTKYALTAGGSSFIFTTPEGGGNIDPITESIGSASLGTDISADDITSWSAGTNPSLTVTSTSVVTSATVSGTTLSFGTGSVGSASGWSAGTAPSLQYTSRSIPNVSVASKTVVTGFN